jgi:hypothetical protein
LTILGSNVLAQAQSEDPCALLTTAEVQQAFPGSKAGRLDRSQEKRGLLTCLWDYPTGRLSIIAGNAFNEPPKGEAQGWALTLVALRMERTASSTANTQARRESREPACG